LTQKIFMLGGVDITSGQAFASDRLWITEASDGPVCVVDLTSRDLASRSRFRGILSDYFALLTTKDVIFVSEMRSMAEIGTSLSSAGAVYIPGGDTEALLDDLFQRDLAPLLRSVTCVVAGNSAGAVALCRNAVLTTDHRIKTPTVRLGLGMVDFSIDPHYDSSHDDELISMSENVEIFGLPEESVIVQAKDGSTEFHGPAWRFLDGRKEMVSSSA